jgi:hypothetical protein
MMTFEPNIAAIVTGEPIAIAIGLGHVTGYTLRQGL